MLFWIAHCSVNEMGEKSSLFLVKKCTFLNSCDRKHRALLWTALLMFMPLYTYGRTPRGGFSRDNVLLVCYLDQYNYFTFWAVCSKMCLLPPCNTSFYVKGFLLVLKKWVLHTESREQEQMASSRPVAIKWHIIVTFGYIAKKPL